jgi:hypothetical protein
MEKLRKIKEDRKTDQDLKPTGKQLFEEKIGKGLGDFKLEVDGEDEGEEYKDEEGEASDSDEEEQKPIYDKSLFAQEEELAGEDVDFD